MIKTPKKQRQNETKKAQKSSKENKNRQKNGGPGVPEERKKSKKEKTKTKRKTEKNNTKKRKRSRNKKQKTGEKTEGTSIMGYIRALLWEKTLYAYRISKLIQRFLVFRKMFQKAVTDLNEQYFTFLTFIYVGNFHKCVSSSAPSPKILEKPLLINKKSILFTILST